MLKQFQERMMDHLRSDFTEKTKNITDMELRNIIQLGVQIAESYGVVDETDVERFLDCIIFYGHDFDTNYRTLWAGKILKDKNLSGTEKMNHINDYELCMISGK